MMEEQLQQANETIATLLQQLKLTQQTNSQLYTLLLSAPLLASTMCLCNLCAFVIMTTQTFMNRTVVDEIFRVDIFWTRYRNW